MLLVIWNSREWLNECMTGPIWAEFMSFFSYHSFTIYVLRYYGKIWKGWVFFFFLLINVLGNDYSDVFSFFFCLRGVHYFSVTRRKKRLSGEVSCT